MHLVVCLVNVCSARFFLFRSLIRIVVYFSATRRYPIHCAVMGGNLDLVKWLVEAHGCPLSMKPSAQSGILLSVQTSKSRTLMDLAMTGPPKIDILAYLVSKNLSVSDTNDYALVPKTLQTTMTIMNVGNEPFGLLGYSNNCCDASVATVKDDVR